MNQFLFDNTLLSQWSGSHDESSKDAWQEILSASGSKADFRALFDEMFSLYWDGVEQEIAAALIAFVDFNELAARGAEDADSTENFETRKIRPLVDLWNPFGEAEAASVKSSVAEQWPTLTESLTVEERRARALLQGLGFLDIDFVREARRPVFRSWGQKPQVVNEGPSRLSTRQCSECRHLIRTFHFYECREGCQTSHGQRDMYKMNPLRTGARGTGDYESPDVHYYNASKHLESRTYRLCPACLPKSLHPRGHLKAVRGFTRVGDKRALDFALELDLWEEELDGHFWDVLGVNALDTLSSASQLFSRTSSRQIFPAGNNHCAFMLGPLLIENGMTSYPGGALISRRPLPNFSASSARDLQDFLSEPSWYRPYKDKGELLHHRLLSYSSQKRLYRAEVPIRERRFLTCIKQVSGGLFTSYCARFAEEKLIVQAFIDEAEAWQELKADRSLSQKQYRFGLKAGARTIADLIHSVFEEDITLAIRCFAAKLHREVKLQYNRLTNNCQDFCNAMLLNGDSWDMMFDNIYPPVPANLAQTPDTTCMRYMMSFAGRMVHPHHEVPYVDYLTSATQMYNKFGHNDADIIDHISSIRFKSDPDGFHLGIANSCHDEILLKAEEDTCHAFSDSTCTLADHLLDGPHDNLSLLTMHIHRQRDLYTVPTHDDRWGSFDEFLTERGPAAWVHNRLAVLHRLFMLNAFLAIVSRGFQDAAESTGVIVKGMRDTWSPPRTLLSRAWPQNRRNGARLEKPRWHDDMYANGTSELAEARRAQMVLVVIHTNPIIQSPDVWKMQLRALRDRLHRPRGRSSKPAAATSDLFHGYWASCECIVCGYIAAETNCVRAASYAASQREVEPEARRYSTSHPDYVSAPQLLKSIKHLGLCRPVIDTLRQLWTIPEYLGIEETAKLLQECGAQSEDDIEAYSKQEGAETELLDILGFREERSIRSIIEDYFGGPEEGIQAL